MIELSIDAADRYLVAAKETAGADWQMSVELRYLDWLMREVVGLRSAALVSAVSVDKTCKCGEVITLGVRVFCTEVPL